MPLTAPVRLISCNAKIITHCWHAVGVEPEDVWIERFLRCPSGLRDAVQRRVLAGIDRRPARRASDRCGVVTLEVHAILAQQILSLQEGLAECLRLRRLV